jgi:Recombinase
VLQVLPAGAGINGTLMQIADALNVRGVPTPRGGRWYATSVKNVLKRPSPALCTLYPERVELAEQVAKGDRAIVGMGETQARRKITRAGGPRIVERRPLIHGQIAPTFIRQNAKRFLRWRLRFIRPC